MATTHGAQNVSTDGRQELAADLHRLLLDQIACAREGHFAKVEGLSIQVDAIVTRMMECRNRMALGEDIRREGLERLYGELVLMLKAEQTDVEGSLKQLRRVKRAVGAYGRKTRRRSSRARSIAQ